MKFLMRFLAVALVLTSRAWAQTVTIEIDAPQDVYLPGETVQLHVHIKNKSGRRLHFGDDREWLTFSVTAHNRKQVPKVRAADVEGEFDLENGFEATRKVEINPAYNLNALGFYLATATVRVRELAVELTSPVPCKFEVVRGLKLWDQDFGVPLREGEPASTIPETRRFSLIQLRTTNQIRLYYRLADASDHLPIRVVSLGQIVAFTPPEAQMDRYCNLHVLFQSYRRTFTHSIVSPDGELLGRTAYDVGTSRPGLKLDERNHVVVSGGFRMNSTNDIPAIPRSMIPRPLPPLPPAAATPPKDSTKKDSAKKDAAVAKPKK